MAGEWLVLFTSFLVSFYIHRILSWGRQNSTSAYGSYYGARESASSAFSIQHSAGNTNPFYGMINRYRDPIATTVFLYGGLRVAPSWGVWKVYRPNIQWTEAPVQETK